MKKKQRDHLLSALFLFPALFLLCVFIIYPTISTIHLSFHSWNGIGLKAKEFNGLTNYIKVLTSDTFWNSLLNSFYFMLGTFLIQMPLTFGLGLLVTSKLKCTDTMKTVYYLPMILGMTTISLMWSCILNPNTGILSGILNSLGLDDYVIDWLSTPTVNVWVTILVNIWKHAGYNMLIFASGLTSIPDSIIEASMIDGCTYWQRLRYILIPLCKNTFKVYAILGVTGCLKVFDIIWAMTKGGPNDVSSTPAVMIYNFAYTYRKYGRSAAIAVLLLILGVSLSIVCNKIFKQEDIY